MALEEVEEEDLASLVGQGGGKRLANDDVPACGLVLELGVRLDLSLNFRRELLVHAALQRCLLAHYSRGTELNGVQAVTYA